MKAFQIVPNLKRYIHIKRVIHRSQKLKLTRGLGATSLTWVMLVNITQISKHYYLELKTGYTNNVI